ncbi:MAG: hypothetical protein ACOC56_05685 [Atribacterota bacterium]
MRDGEKQRSKVLSEEEIDKYIDSCGGLTAMYQKAYSQFVFSDKINNKESPHDEARGYFLKDLIINLNDMQARYLRHGDVDEALWCRGEIERNLTLLKTILKIED